MEKKIKKKKVFLNKHHIKNKNFQRKKHKYFTDKKFLRKFKKIKQLNETKTEIVKTDPIKNFFFTPTNEGDIKEQEQNEESEIKTFNKLENIDSKNGDNKSDEEPDEEEQDENGERNIKSRYNNIKKKGGKTDIYRKELSLIEKNKQGQLSKEEKEALVLKKKQEKDEKKKKRFQKFKRLNQKTKKGQPVMKNLIKHLIKKI